ncbi:aminotransferase class I/II-fold pyridoxal phosphate-dependent enzyme [Neobacillus citreus]|uniref:Aminotransferase class I/II-fold pyridoxal phosphate-dependent enzyme n=1 Tax=Neobacillus citreus TaxID=2833578 RepID=A0A942T977_9BACI|nr:aminotransferase class I/II-fold pyridoxal phosphate-dependent enzyme [Neobacillus citreus]MCH6267901.1 aminotransferase class I/II-fold pyridoxal phosphate-dependent enzyme [Neobacillus citreus]
MFKQMKTPLYDALIKHEFRKPVSFHVPGHKYGLIFDANAQEHFKQILKLDATELTGLDDFHSPEGAILEAEDLLTQLYQSKKSYFLVNGSTVGNIAMILTACSEDDTVLVQRNSHKSVLNAIQLAKARPIFLEPEYDQEWMVPSGISVETVKEAIRRYPNAKALILTYPNYYGVVYDLQGIIQEAHGHNIPVLVDEAHGPHFILGRPFPASAVQLGADIVVQSAHKTLPAMTMGSFLHFNSCLLDNKKIKGYLEMFQSSSPSYPIMASLDLARGYLAAYEQRDLEFLQSEISLFKRDLADVSAIKVLDYPNQQGDLLKITLQSRSKLSGFELQQRLEEYSIYTELADPNNLLFILPLLKDEQKYSFRETAAKINEALKDIFYDCDEEKEEIQLSNNRISELAIPFKKMGDYEEWEISISEAEDKVCAETIIPYPPGIPLLLKGERITAEKLSRLHRLMKTGARFQGGSILRKSMLKVFWTT